jgi:hypothetical protein
MDTDDDIPEDQLLDVPEDNIADLYGFWSLRSILLHEREIIELNRGREGNARPRMLMPWDDPREIRRIEEKRRREQHEYQQALREITERQDRLLLRIEQEEAAIAKRRQEIDDHALRLQDGRGVYVDGERYRDGEGRVLTGADEAEAAHQHEYRPDASTWKDKQDIDHRYAEAEKLKNQVLADRQSGVPPSDEASRMDGYEKEFADKVEAKAAQPVIGYGAVDDYQLRG